MSEIPKTMDPAATTSVQQRRADAEARESLRLARAAEWAEEYERRYR